MPNLPPNLEILQINDNFIVDQFPNTFPSTAMTINAANNLIYGNYPNHLPDSIQELYLSHNRLQGTITTFPALLTYFEASGNLINGTFPDLPLRFLTARLDFNLLSGNLLFAKPSGLTVLHHNRLVKQ
eukprot:NODE_1226_length_1709_cov_0.432919.p2 type:complete len:128 gc:universal NODE_1226_length_1709_cov_0.432919:1282-1665(+)